LSKSCTITVSNRYLLKLGIRPLVKQGAFLWKQYMELDTNEQVIAALILMSGMPLPVHLAFALTEQGIILDEFIESYIN